MAQRSKIRVALIFIAFACGLLAPSWSLGQQVTIELHNSANSRDHYLCWSPVQGRAKLASSSTTPVDVRLTGMATPTGGALQFQRSGSQRPTPSTFQPQPEITVTLSANGAWMPFWVAGKKASSGSQDVAIVAQDVAGGELGRLPVMVRVRKDAERMDAGEIRIFLEALRDVHDIPNGSLSSKFTKHARAHGEAFQVGIHHSYSGFPLFLAWHRAFLINLERDLQTADPRVALPYWRFDKPARRLFSADFLGAVPETGSPGAEFLVQFSPTNPITVWDMGDSRGGLVRSRNGSSTAPVAADQLEDLLANSDLNTYQALSGNLELNYHNDAHRLIGGWLGSRTSPRDPLFFLLHANVDRAWAHWQAKNSTRFDADGAHPGSYSAPGAYPGPATPGRFRKGTYAQDLMWPWSGQGGTQGTPDGLDDWPSIAWPMPSSAGPSGLVLPPTPSSQVDYLDVSARGLAHGACYDDIDYWGRPTSVTP